MRRLSNRLLAIAGLAGSGECVADVGTDHGYLPIFLIEQGRMKRAIAMDVRKGPLSRAQAHIREHQLTDYIETRCSDGLAALKPGEAEVIVIAGMGGSLMSRILSQGEAAITQDTRLVLQPQSEILEFRQFLLQQGYGLLAEEMVKEDGKYYPMMMVRREQTRDAWDGLAVVRCSEESSGGKARSVMRGGAGDGAICAIQGGAGDGTVSAIQGAADRYTRMELKYGPLLLRDRHPVLLEYLLDQQKKQELIAERLAAASEDVAVKRRRQIKQELKELAQALERYGRSYGVTGSVRRD